jgi:hypothetical protein
MRIYWYFIKYILNNIFSKKMLSTKIIKYQTRETDENYKILVDACKYMTLYLLKQ